MSAEWVQWGFNTLLAIATFFGANWLRRMERDMEQMQEAHKEAAKDAAQRERELQEQLRGYVAKEDFREFRDEIRGNFREVFGKIDTLAERLPPKVIA
jgi:plasmid stabilization system protein ParE